MMKTDLAHIFGERQAGAAELGAGDAAGLNQLEAAFIENEGLRIVERGNLRLLGGGGERKNG